MKRNLIRATNFICNIVILILLVGCFGGTPTSPASTTQIHGETGILSNYSSVSFDVNLTPMRDNQALIRSVVITADVDLPVCGYRVQVILSVFSNGSLVWDKTGVNKIHFVQPIPFSPSKTVTVEPNSLIVVEGGNSYIQLEYGIMLGEIKDKYGEPICDYAVEPDFWDPSNAWQAPSLVNEIEFDRYSYGTLRIDIPPINELPLPQPISTDVFTPVPNCQAPNISDLSFTPNSGTTIGTLVEIHAVAAWNPCFRAMRLLIDDKFVYELGQPRFTYVWDTSSFSSGEHIIRLEVAAQGDNDWLKPSVRESPYALIPETPPTPTSTPRSFVRLAPQQDGESNCTTPCIFYSNTVEVNVSSITPGSIILSSTFKALRSVVTDDEVRIYITHPDSSQAEYVHTYGYPACIGCVPPTPPVDLSSLFQIGTNTVTIELWDNIDCCYGTSGYYLVGRLARK